MVNTVAISTLAGVGEADGFAEGEIVGVFVGKYDGREEGTAEMVGIELGSKDCVGTGLGREVGAVDGLELGLGDGEEEWTTLGSDDSIGVGWALGEALG